MFIFYATIIKHIHGGIMPRTFLTILTILSTLLLLSSSTQVKHVAHLCKGIAPKNNLYIGVDKSKKSNVRKKDFTSILKKVRDIYGPIIDENGATLSLLGDWNDGTVNAYASRSGDTWNVRLFGGLARHELMSKDAFAMVICHELGHHIGGLPKKSSWNWAVNEGQADYFASLKCMRRIFQDDNNRRVIRRMKVPNLARKNCENSFNSKEGVAICIRTAIAGISLANVLHSLGRGVQELSLETPDPEMVKQTNHSHPAAQCRLDTYFSGAVCEKSYTEDVSFENENIGVCSRFNNFELGNRPRCWYMPSDI